MSGSTVRPSNKSGYLPSLDGWRAVAILAVLMTHDQPWSIGKYSDVSFKSYGGSGVALFFAISGILICWRILEDEAVRGVFHLKEFYIRRLFRIQPASLAYLLLIAFLMLLGLVHERWHFWFGGLFLYENFLYHTQNRTLIFAGFFTGHFWTLSVEEHFYLVLSLCLFVFRRYRIVALAALYLVLHLTRAWATAHGLYSEDVSTRRTYWVLTYLIVPSLLVAILRQPLVYKAAQRFLSPWVAVMAMLLLMSVLFLMRHPARELTPSNLFSIEWGRFERLWPLWIIATMLHPRSLTTRFLELAPLRFIGRLSYSIYVWHLLFLCATEPETHITWHALIALNQRPWRYVGILSMALLSYYFIEKPMIRLGHKLAPPATSGHRDLKARLSVRQDDIRAAGD